MNKDVEEALLAMRDRDLEMRSALVERGELQAGYHPDMERVHVENASELESLLDRGGWPRRSVVGAAASEAAWLVATHGISRPAFQRRCLALLQEAAESGEASAAHAAMLADRISFHERRPQRYGTLLDWDEAGRLRPWTLEDPDRVDEHRRQVGLPPLAVSVERSRAEAEREGGPPTQSFGERQAQFSAWARRVGWIED